MSLCLGKFKSHVAPVFTVWLFGQLAGQFAIHWSLISQLKHAHYIAKFMVVKRYGITYGSISLISMSSYGKCYYKIKARLHFYKAVHKKGVGRQVGVFHEKDNKNHLLLQLSKHQANDLE
ncbi:hypothetical protein TYRP_010160 [Tyrophagus putrescentiae]|nr:hypothetical protein TYRP_010160 [Tyrophagus putrescentiae]